jgi:hypothetical protein
MRPLNRNLRVTRVTFTQACVEAQKAGHLGWVSFVLNDSLKVDGCALRRTLDGRPALSFPARRGSTGEQHPYLRPLNDRARCEIERQVFRALGLVEAR